MSTRIPTEESLDTQQRNFLKKLKDGHYTDQNVWVKGLPGGGKSMLLVYAIKYLLNSEATRNAKILLVVFTHSLIKLCRAELAGLNTIDMKIVTVYEFLKTKRKYDYTFCDEVRDLTSRILIKIKDQTRYILVVAGDSNQSIYSKDPRYQEAVVIPERITQLINSENWRLLYVYRLVRSTITAIQKVISSMNIFSAKRYMLKRDTQICLCRIEFVDQEIKCIMREARKFANHNQGCTILFPTKDRILEFCDTVLQLGHKPVWEKWVDRYYEPCFKRLSGYLKENQALIEYIVSSYGSLLAAENDKRIVIIAYHGVEGLDFDNVLIPFADIDLYIPGGSNITQKLSMVAISRSGNSLHIAYTGIPLSHVSLFSSGSTICANISISNELHPNLLDGISVDFWLWLK